MNPENVTLLDFFAAHAMNTLIQANLELLRHKENVGDLKYRDSHRLDSEHGDRLDEDTLSSVAQSAYQAANAMLAARGHYVVNDPVRPCAPSPEAPQ